MYSVANSHKHTLCHQHLALEMTLALFKVFRLSAALGQSQGVS